VIAVKRHSENARAHFALSYVLRYAGILEQAADECGNVLALGPGKLFPVLGYSPTLATPNGLWILSGLGAISRFKLCAQFDATRSTAERSSGYGITPG
jgi:hypothetical protein